MNDHRHNSYNEHTNPNHTTFHGHRFEGYWDFGGNKTSPAICDNQTLQNDCTQFYIGSFGIQSPELVPCCLVAIYLGFTLGRITLKTKTNSNITYAITFFTLGCMMTFSMITNSFTPLNCKPDGFINVFTNLIDVGLTSCVGYSFLIDGLVDFGVLSQYKKRTYHLLAGGYILIFIGWIITGLKLSFDGYLFMYYGIVGFCCGSWVVIQFMLMETSKNYSALRYFLIAAVSGAVGFVSVLDLKINALLCEMFTCYFGGEFTWFVATDVSIYCIFLFYKARHGIGSNNQDPIRNLYQRLRSSF